MKNNVGLFLAKRAHLNPALTACIDPAGNRSYTYRELNERCNGTAGFLHALGVRKGDRVALLLLNSPEYMESFFAVAKIGAVVVPLNWRLVADELEFILSDAGATTLIFSEEFAPMVEDLKSRGLESLQNWVCVDGVGGDQKGLPAFAESYAKLQGGAAVDEPVIDASDDDDLYIMYTSGTTGHPKGVVHTHSTAMWGALTISVTSDVRYRDVYIVALPLFHVGALTPLTVNVYRGATSILMRTFDPVEVWKLVQEHNVTVMLAVPAMLNFMLQVLEKAGFDYSSLRWIMSGAAPVPVTLIQAYAGIGIEIHQVYGLTETCGPACLISPEDAISKAGSTGKAFFHTNVRIVDDAGNDVPAGDVGEVIVSGRHIMKEYWRRPDETAKTIRDGWLYTGDLASMDEEGFVYIQDRKKDMIISGGENIYPAELENVLLGHAGITDAAVIGQPSPKWGESPLAIVVRSDESLAESAVLEYCEGKLARFKMPKGVEFVDEIPRNPSGKILKRILRDRFPGPAEE